MTSLFHKQLTVAVLASGSSGNCTYIGDGQAGVLIDCGISARQVLVRMAQIGLGEAPIDAVLITHEHSDHVGGARMLARRLKSVRGREIPFYMTRGTEEGTNERSLPARIERVVAGETFRVRHLSVDPFPIPHDVRDPVAYRIQIGDAAVAVLTDLGRSTALVRSKLQGLDVLVLESNHDEQMLRDGPYPWRLKQRISSTHGHLSNRQTAALIRKVVGPKLKHLILAHLSEKNNSPYRALDAARGALAEAGMNPILWVARQEAPMEPITMDIGV